MSRPVKQPAHFLSGAGVAFASLILLAGAVIAIFAGLLLWQGPALIQGIWLACQDALAALRGAWPAFGLALPVLLLVSGLLLAGHSLAGQLWHTRRLVCSLAWRRQPLPAGLASLAEELNLAGRLVLVTDEQPYTFAQGLVRPRIWLSSGLLELLDQAELRAVLRHEQHHVRQRDPLRVLFSRSLARLLFFLPLAGMLRDAFLVAKEVEADVASQADGPLAAALLKLLQSEACLPAGANLAAIGPVDATPARLERLLQAGLARPRANARLRRQLWLSLFLGLALTMTSYLSLAHAASLLAGGRCGYSIPATDWQAMSVDYTPTSLSLR